jgi:hypothetical protein
VLNAGVNKYGTAQSCCCCDQNLALRPDVVVLVFFWNDINSNYVRSSALRCRKALVWPGRSRREEVDTPKRRTDTAACTDSCPTAEDRRLSPEAPVRHPLGPRVRGGSTASRLTLTAALVRGSATAASIGARR